MDCPDQDLATAPANELVHVAGVVGKQHKRLEMLGGRAGVVAQARGEKSTRRASKCDRGKLCRVINPVSRLIANL